jgi:hypothetical protein
LATAGLAISLVLPASSCGRARRPGNAATLYSLGQRQVESVRLVTTTASQCRRGGRPGLLLAVVLTVVTMVLLGMTTGAGVTSAVAVSMPGIPSASSISAFQAHATRATRALILIVGVDSAIGDVGDQRSGMVIADHGPSDVQRAGRAPISNGQPSDLGTATTWSSRNGGARSVAPFGDVSYAYDWAGAANNASRSRAALHVRQRRAVRGRAFSDVHGSTCRRSGGLGSTG